jgi:serine/threonine-protein kinase
MLVGSSPFVGETATDSIGAVLHKNLDLDRLPPATPANVRRVLARCLQRDRDLRLRDIGDARLELLRAENSGSLGSITPSRISTGLLVGLGVLIAFLVGAAVWIVKPGAPVAPGKTVHAMVRLPDDIEPAGWPVPDLSDDGRRLAMRVERENQSMIVVRDLDAPELRIIPGTEGAGAPVFSPDGEWLLYGHRNSVYRRLIAGGPSIRICDVESGRGWTWENDNSIILAPRRVGPLHRVSASGGVPVPMYEMGGPQTLSDRHPCLLPGGRGVLFHRCEGDSADWDETWLMVLPSEGGSPRELLKGVSHGRYVNSGHLVYQREDSLFAVGFDLETLEFTTPETIVLEGNFNTIASAPSIFDLSADGTLVYFEGSNDQDRRRIVEVDFEGAVTPLSSHVDTYEEIVPSDDGRFIAVELNQLDYDQVQVIELARDIVSPLAAESGSGNFAPVWSPDGRWIAFTSDRDDASAWRQLYRARIGSASPAERIIKTEKWTQATDWSSDGRSLIVEYRGDGDPYRNIGVIRFDDSGVVVSEDIEPLIAWPGFEYGARLSPDDRWVIFHSWSEQTGVRLYVASMADPSVSVQVSAGEANHSAWSPDGRTVYYTNDDAVPMTVYAVDFTVNAAEEPVVSSPRPVVDLVTVNALNSLYVNSDGTAFIVGESVDQTGVRPERAPLLILNLSTWLERRVPAPGGR